MSNKQLLHESDARPTAPSFDELVLIIKKLFTDYLEDFVKSKPSEIKKSWERYKTLNHLYQDTATAGDTFLLNRLGITLENIYRIHSVQWNEYDRSVIRGILDQWEQSKNDSGHVAEYLDESGAAADEQYVKATDTVTINMVNMNEVEKLKDENKRLNQWKKEAIQIINPIMEYAQGHKDAKLGGSCVDFILNRCKGFDELKAGSGEKEVKPEPPAFEIKAGLKFRNVHMPGHLFNVEKVFPEYNKVWVWIVPDKDGGTCWMEKDWNLQHTQWAFEKGEYFIEKEVPDA